MDQTFGEQWEPRLRELFPLDLPPERPLYLLHQYELPPGFGRFTDHGIGGYTAPALSQRLKNHLRRMGVWRGIGFAIVVDLWSMLAIDEAAQLALIVHELGHCLENAWALPLLRLPSLGADIFSGPKPDEHFAADDGHRIAAPWESHTTRWLRCVIHLRHRAELAGMPLAFPQLSAAGPFYGLSPADAYGEILADEVHDQATQPIERILETRCPAAMQDLFRADVERYFAGKIDADIAREMASGKTLEESLKLAAAAKGR